MRQDFNQGQSYFAKVTATFCNNYSFWQQLQFFATITVYKTNDSSSPFRFSVRPRRKIYESNLPPFLYFQRNLELTIFCLNKNFISKTVIKSPPSKFSKLNQISLSLSLRTNSQIDLNTQTYTHKHYQDRFFNRILR